MKFPTTFFKFPWDGSGIKSFLALTGLAAIAATSLLSCKPEGGTGSNTIRIGAVLPLTGSLAPYGKWSQNAIELATDDLRRAGQAIEVIVEDSRSSPKDAVSAFNKLQSVNKVPVIIGFIGSSEALACAPIANETRTVLFSSAAASPDLSKAGDYVFRNRVSGSLEVEALGRYARNQLKLKNVAVIFINTDYGKSYESVFREEFTRGGGTIALAEGFDQGTTDFRSQIEKLLRQPGLDGVYLPVHTKEGATFLKQAKELGLKVQFLASNAIISPDLFTIAGNAAENLVYSEQAYDSGSSNEATRKFDEAYSKRFGAHSEMFAANAYDAVRIVALAIKKGGYSADEIKQELYKIRDYPGASGQTTFDSNGDVQKPIAIKQIRNQASVVLTQ